MTDPKFSKERVTDRRGNTTHYLYQNGVRMSKLNRYEATLKMNNTNSAVIENADAMNAEQPNAIRADFAANKNAADATKPVKSITAMMIAANT